MCRLLKITKVSFIPDFLAISLCFGYYTNPSLQDRHGANNLILLIDMGYLSFSTTLVSYKLDSCEILSHICDTKICGRLIDEILIDFIGKKIKDEYGVNINNNPKLFLRTKQSVISCKEKLSATGASDILLSVDDVNSDGDTFEMVLERSVLDNLIESNKIMEQIHDTIERTLVGGFVSKEQMPSIEFVFIGGSMRITCIQQAIQKMYNKEKINLTLNMDESAALGCTYYQSILLNVWNYKYKNPFPFSNTEQPKSFLARDEIYYKNLLKYEIDLYHSQKDNQMKSKKRNMLEAKVYDIEREFDSLPFDKQQSFISLKPKIIAGLKDNTLSSNEIDKYEALLNQIDESNPTPIVETVRSRQNTGSRASAASFDFSENTTPTEKYFIFI